MQFCDQIQASMHQIFTQIHSTVSKGASYLKYPSEFSQARLKRCFPTFHCITFSSCCLPSFSSLEPSYPILESQKTYKILLDSEQPPHTLFFHFEENSFFFFLHRNSLPQLYMYFQQAPMSLLKACVRYCLSNFYLSPNDSPSTNMKNVFYFI